MISLTHQLALRRQMDVTANNLANMSTAGFKTETVLFEPVQRRPAAAAEQPTKISFVRDWTVLRDFRNGSLTTTNNPLDVALRDEGFFVVQGPQGPLYTRDGQFGIGPQGELVTRDGRAVLDDAGAPITIQTDGEPPRINESGEIFQNDTLVGRIGVVRFERPGALDKIGENLWAQTDEAPTPAPAVRFAQGQIENSNVVPVVELTRMMEIARAYESATRLQRQADDMRQRSLERLARVS